MLLSTFPYASNRIFLPYIILFYITLWISEVDISTVVSISNAGGIKIENLFIICWLHFWYYYSTSHYRLTTIFICNNNYFVIDWFFTILYSVFTILSYSSLLILWLYIILWLSDIIIESFIALTIIEQLSWIIGIKLLLLSELMLFFACFWSYISFRLIGSTLLLFYFPLLSCYSFSIPFTNPLVLLFSSLPIQCSQIFIKIGFLNYSIEGLGQSPSAGFYSIILQCKEFLYSYFSLTDCVIGSIHYLTTGLHGFHVVLGSLDKFRWIYASINS